MKRHLFEREPTARKYNLEVSVKMMEEKNFNLAMEVFQALLAGEEISLEGGKNTDLYEAYSVNAQVNDIVDHMLKTLNLKLYDYNYSLFITAGDHNRIFGFSNEELKKSMGLRLNKELYLCYYIMFQVMLCFYSDSATYTYVEYVKLEDIIDMVDKNLHSTIQNINLLVKNELEETSFETLAVTWDELPVMSNEDTAEVRAGRGSKAGYIKLVFNFLIQQNLFIEAQEKYYPTNRFHAIIRSYFEEERGRLFELQQELAKKEEIERATY